MRDDDDVSAHALFSCPLFDGKKFKRDDGETLTRQKLDDAPAWRW